MAGAAGPPRFRHNEVVRIVRATGTERYALDDEPVDADALIGQECSVSGTCPSGCGAEPGTEPQPVWVTAALLMLAASLPGMNTDRPPRFWQSPKGLVRKSASV